MTTTEPAPSGSPHAARLIPAPVFTESAIVPSSALSSSPSSARQRSSTENCSSCVSRCGAARLRENSACARSVRSGSGPVLAAFR